MGATSDVTVEEAKANLLSEPKRLFVGEAFDVLDDLDDDGTGELGAPFIIVDAHGNPIAAMVPVSYVQGAGWCAPSP